MSQDDVYSTGEVAKLCHVQRSTVIRWIKRGALPAYQLPGRGDRRVQGRDLVTFMQQSQLPIPPELEPISRRVLVVEDEVLIARSMKLTLESAGFEVQVVHDAFRAGNLVESWRPRVMTLDLNMAGLDGSQILLWLRNRTHLQPLRVMIVSAMPKQHLEEALKEGADRVLRKPFRDQELVDQVSALMDLTIAPLLRGAL